MIRPAISDFYSTRFRRSTLLICAAHGAFFTALFVAYFYLKATVETAGLDWPTPFHFGSLLMVAAMSMFALSGSVTSALSVYAAKQNEREPAVRWLAIGISCWLVFMFLEIVEWVRLVYIVQLGPHTPFGQIFLALTGCHWICIFVCVMWMGVVTADTRRRDVVAVSMYCHFLNLVWLAMLVVLYFLNADLEGL